MDDALHNLKSIENILILANFADKILMPAKILLKICIIYIGFEARPLCKFPCKNRSLAILQRLRWKIAEEYLGPGF